jgi:hypothetical protein
MSTADKDNYNPRLEALPADGFSLIGCEAEKATSRPRTAAAQAAAPRSPARPSSSRRAGRTTAARHPRRAHSAPAATPTSWGSSVRRRVAPAPRAASWETELTELTQFHIQRLGTLRTDRGNWNSQWEEAADRVIPAHRNSFNGPLAQRQEGEKKTELQFDSTAALAARSSTT